MTTRLTTKEMAIRCGVSQRQVQRWCESGDLPAEKIGRDWIIDEEEARKFMVEREINLSADR